MLCPVCNTQNAPAADVCKSCGAPLGVADLGPQSHALPAGVSLRQGQYTIGKVLGQGGFGITYQGSEPALRRSVAVKEFFPQGCVRRGTTVSSGGGISPADYGTNKQRFIEEAQTLARFEHPNIVRVHSCFEENATAYMVMELLEGRSLAAILEQRGRLQELQAVEYVRSVGEGLSAVHAAHLLHRDIKPDNIMVLSSGRVVLVDFGSAREFASGRTRRMTAMLTPGYAPLEQYGHEARFGVYTDIYALGATLYHLVTGQLPVQATDRAAGVDLRPPTQVEPQVSTVVSDAVMWAMQMKAEKRPQSVTDLLQALAGTKSPPSARGPKRAGTSATPQVPVPPPSPYEVRLDQIIRELDSPIPPAPTGEHDKSISSLERELAALAGKTPTTLEQCPGCRNTVMTRHTGQVTAACPLCREARLRQRHLDESKCAVCREGELSVAVLDTKQCFCPVCRTAIMQCERRKRFGLSLDLWWVCPQCKAEIDVFTGGRAKLMSFHDDPHGTGARLGGRVMAVSEWRKVAERLDQYLHCRGCGAQFEAAGAEELRLMSAPNDPHGVGRKYLSKALTKLTWSKMAVGAQLTTGNLYCPNCSAEFDHEQVDGRRTLTCLELGSNPFAWDTGWLTRRLPIQTWYLAMSGKPSLNPGLLCASCATEFDLRGGQYELVKTSAAVLHRHGGQAHSLEDWHRLVAGLPDLTAEEQMRRELERVKEQKRRDQAQWAESQERHRQALRADLERLLKQAYLAGAFPIQLRETRAGLRSGEHLLWESPGAKLKIRTSQGYQYYESDWVGTIVVTDDRLIFVSDLGQVWQRKSGKMAAVQMIYVGKQRVLLVCTSALFAGRPLPCGVTTGPR